MDLYYLEETYQTLKQHKLRSVLTGFGVMWGIFSLVLLLGLGKGLENGVFRKFKGLSKNTLSIHGNRDKYGKHIKFSIKLIDSIKSKFDFIKATSPGVWAGQIKYISYKDKVYKGSDPHGVGIDYCKINNLSILDGGRGFNVRDFNNKRQVCIIGDSVREELFLEKEAIGKIINISGSGFKIIGILEAGKGFSGWAKKSVLIPYNVFQDFYTHEEDYHGPMWFLLKDKVNASKAQEEIIEYVYDYLNVHKTDRKNRVIRSWNIKKEVDKINSLFKTINIFIWFIGLCFLLSGAVGIGNMMLVVIKERTKEIGIRKVIGAKPIEILSMIMTEAVLITLISGIIGMILGMVSIKIGNLILLHIDKEKKMMIGELSFEPIKGVVSILILIVIGGLSGLIPARRATNLLPIKALSEE